MSRYKLINRRQLKRIVNGKGKNLSKAGAELIEKSFEKYIETCCNLEQKKTVDFKQKVMMI